MVDRPNPPCLTGFFDPAQATRDQRISCLAWSICWTKTEGVAPDELLLMLDRMIDGHPRPRKVIGASALDAAIRVLRSSAQRNRMQRTKRALPRAVLNRGPSDFVCAAAEQHIGLVVEVGAASTLPLPGCDQAECLCWYRQTLR